MYILSAITTPPTASCTAGPPQRHRAGGGHHRLGPGPTTRTDPKLFGGPRPPMSSWRALQAIFSELPTQDSSRWAPSRLRRIGLQARRGLGAAASGGALRPLVPVAAPRPRRD